MEAIFIIYVYVYVHDAFIKCYFFIFFIFFLKILHQTPQVLDLVLHHMMST